MAKFKVGDRIRQIKSGRGTNIEDNGKEAIVRTINENYFDTPGITIERLGDTCWECTQKVVGEEGFELVKDVGMKEMQINNCSRDEREIIYALAKKINPSWNKHLEEYGDFIMTYPNFHFNGRIFGGTYSSSRFPNVTFNEFIQEMLKQNPIAIVVTVKLNDQYEARVHKDDKVVCVKGIENIPFSNIIDLYKMATATRSIGLGSHAKAVINKDSTITVGCQTFPFESLENLYKEINK
jgi:hypothetical protein